MKQLNLRQNFYSSVIRSALTLLALVVLLLLVPQADMLANQKPFINKPDITGVEIAKVVISLIIVGVLMYFAYIAETQLPKIKSSLRPLGLIIASAVHITVIFIAYFYLLKFAKNPLSGKVDQIFNGVFIFLLCIPFFRGGWAYFQWAKRISTEWANVVKQDVIKCENCGAENDPLAKHCTECGNKLIPSSSVKNCPKCHAENEISTKFCHSCGTEFLVSSTNPQLIVCPQCGAKNKGDAKHCTDCGTNLVINNS